MRIAVTGIASDFGTVIAPLLLADPEIEEVLGIDIRQPRVSDPKLRFEQEDVRSPRMRELFAGCEAVIHLAFVVSEIHDKELTHSINLGGSKNVIAAAAEGGVKRLVIASSVASYGAHPDYEIPITEAEFPRGNPDKYYFYDKAEVEHYVEWWVQRNPSSQLTITRLRPPVIVGPSFGNPLVDRLASRAVTTAGDSLSHVQLLWEDDLARAFAIAAKRDAPGPFNLGTDDWLEIEELAALHGQRLRRMPARLAAPLAEALFRLRLSPVSADWVVSGESVVSIDRAKSELGWAPRFSSGEAARILLVQRGRPILPGRSEGVFGRKEIAEEALEPVTELHRIWSQRVPGLRDALDGPADVDRIADRVEHALLPYNDKLVHFEVHPVPDSESAPAIVFSPGIGGHARFYLPLLGKLCDAGFNVVGIDRPGHGLSEGRRGDSPVEQALDVIESAVTYARRRFGGPVALLGSSLGGILSWYALTREPDVEAVVCHNITHPSLRHEAAARVKVPLLLPLARAAPFARIPIKQVANFDAVAESDELLEYFRREQDRTWCWTLTARSIASLYEYQAPIDWSDTRTPALVLVGERDYMVTASFTERALAVSKPPRTELRVLEGAGHMLVLEDLDRSLPIVVDWLRKAFAAEHSPTQATAAA